MNRPSKYPHSVEMALDVALLREKELQAENLRLNTIIDNRAEDLEVKAKYDKLQAKVKRLEKGFEKIIATELTNETDVGALGILRACQEIARQALKANKDG